MCDHCRFQPGIFQTQTLSMTIPPEDDDEVDADDVDDEENFESFKYLSEVLDRPHRSSRGSSVSSSTSHKRHLNSDSEAFMETLKELEIVGATDSWGNFVDMQQNMLLQISASQHSTNTSIMSVNLTALALLTGYSNLYRQKSIYLKVAISKKNDKIRLNLT